MFPASTDDSRSSGSCPLEQEGLHKEHANLRLKMRVVWSPESVQVWMGKYRSLHAAVRLGGVWGGGRGSRQRPLVSTSVGKGHVTHTHTHTHTHTMLLMGEDSRPCTHVRARTHTHTHAHARTHTHTLLLMGSPISRPCWGLVPCLRSQVGVRQMFSGSLGPG